MRRQKVHSGLMVWRSDVNTTLKMNGVAAMEVEGLRQMGGRALKQFYAVQMLQQGVGGMGLPQQQQQRVSQSLSSSASNTQSQSNSLPASQSGTQPPPRPLRRMRG